jgi:hypothetical protein
MLLANVKSNRTINNNGKIFFEDILELILFK